MHLVAKVQFWRFTTGPDLSNRGLFFKAALPSPNVQKCDQDGSAWVEGPLGSLKLHLVAKVQFWRFTTGPDLSNRGLFFKAALTSPNVQKSDQDGSAWVEGPLGSLKLHLVAKVQFWRFTTGPDLSNRGLFFKAALPSPNVQKSDQDGSAWVEGPLGSLKLHLVAKVQFWRITTGPDLSNRGLFFKAALPSPNVQKCDQDGSAWVEGPLGSLKLHLVAKVQIWRFTTGPDLSKKSLFFKAALPSPNVQKCDQDGSAWVEGPLGSLKLHLVAKVQFWRFTTGPDLSNRGLFFKAALASPNVEKCDQNCSAWVEGPLGSLKLHLVAKVQFWRFTTGPTLSNRSLFFKAALPSPNVEKCDQDGSAWVEGPLGRLRVP